MPRYFLHLDSDVDAPDPDGVELLDLEAARECALRNARFTAGETIKDEGHFVGDHRIDIEDESGTVAVECDELADSMEASMLDRAGPAIE